MSQWRRLLGLVVLLGLWLPAHAARRRKNSHPDQRDIKIINDSKVTIDVRWIDPTTHEPAPSNLEAGGLVYGGETGLNSYAGHSFLVQELPLPTTGQCRNRQCRKAYFTVTKNEDQIFTVNDQFLVNVEDSHTRATKRARKALRQCQLDTSSPEQTSEAALEQLYQCLEANVNATLTETDEEIDFQKNVRKDMARRLVQYACGAGLPGTVDQTIPTTRALRNVTWQFHDKEAVPAYRVSRNTQILFETPHSAVLFVEEFFSEQECRELALESRPARGSSNVPLSAKRTNPVVQRAMKKLQEFARSFLKGANFSYEHDPILRLYTRFPDVDADEECEMANDGTCVGAKPSPEAAVKTPYNLPTDAATMRVFCELPRKGGALHFPQAGVHIHMPQVPVGTALFIMYAEPQTGQRDEDPFLNELLECPVLEGTLVQAIEHYALA